MNCSIKALKNGYIKLRGFEQFYLARTPEYFDAYMYIYLVRYNGKNILIDAGLPEKTYLDEMYRKFVEESGDKTLQVLQNKDEEILSLLDKEGLNKEDIDYIILTHLHFDHVGGLNLFPNAKIIFSRKGWGYFHSKKFDLIAPRFQIPDYILEYILFEARDRIYLNEDKEEILPGITVEWVGGHSRCSQIIQIKTKIGIVLFCGDVVGAYRNLEEGIPIALIQNLEETLNAMEKIKKIGDIIIPGHDPKILKRFKDGIIL